MNMTYIHNRTRTLLWCLFLLGAAIVSSLPMASAQNITSHYDKHQVLEGEVGNWVGTSTIDGKVFEGRAANRWAPGKSCLIFEETYTPVDEPGQEVTIKGVAGWDAASQCILGQWFSSDGTTATSRYKVEGTSLVGKRTGVDADGKPYTADVILKHEPGKYQVEITNVLVDGQAMPGVSAAFNRVKLADVKDTPAAKWMQRLLGKWEYEWENGRTGTMEFDLRADKNVVLGERENNDGSTAIQLGSVDVSSGILLDTGYASDGSRWMIEYTEFTDTTMHGRYTDLIQADGSRLDGAHQLMEVVDEDTIKGVLTVAGEDGAKTLQSVTLRRKKD
jgi:hypothetical protein